MTARLTSITSRDNPLLLRLRKLVGEPAGYRKTGLVWIEGEHLCGAYLQRGGSAVQAVIGESGWGQAALRRLANTAAAVALVPDALLAELSGLESPASLGFVVPWAGAGAVQAGVPTVVLDRLQDPGNVGNILRSAAAFGFGQVIAMKGSAALWSPKVLRAGMGANFGLRLIEQVEVDALDALRIPLLATSSHTTQAVHLSALPWPCAWVLGHEGQGVSAALLKRCAQTLRIPQPGGEESLNAAAAAAICLYESARQRASA